MPGIFIQNLSEYLIHMARNPQRKAKTPIGQQDTGRVRANNRHTAAYLLTPMSNHTLPGSALLSPLTEIASLMNSLHRGSSIFREYFEHAPKPGSSSTFA